MALQPSDTLFNGHYRILRQLGRGGFGFVYLAEDTLLAEQVAIKELIPASFLGRGLPWVDSSVGKKGFRVHNILIVGPAQQPDCPLGFQVVWPEFGISQSLGYVILSMFRIGTQADRPKKFGLVQLWIMWREAAT